MGIPISSLPLADALTGAEQYPIVQNGTTKRTTLNASGVAYDPAGTGAVATTVQSKLREFVSAEDFGAVASLAVDSGAAIQAALDYAESSGAREVFLSGQFYKSTIGLKIPNGVTLRGRGVGAWDTVFPNRPKEWTGTSILFAGTGVKSEGFYGVTDLKETGGWRTDGSDIWKLSNWMNTNAVGTSRATPKQFSAAVSNKVRANDATEAHGYHWGLKDIRICPWIGTDGYSDYSNKAMTSLGDEWDVGLLSINSEYECIENVQVVGYWREAGTLRVQPGYSEYGSGERGEYRRFKTQGYRGLVIRASDTYPVTAATGTTIQIPWSSSHYFDTTGRIEIPGNWDYDYTGLSFSGDKLTFTGVTKVQLGAPDPSTLTGNTIRSFRRGTGVAGTKFDNVVVSGLCHVSELPATSLGFSEAAPAFEICGFPIRGMEFFDFKVQNRSVEPLLAIIGECEDTLMYGCQFENGKVVAAPLASTQSWAAYPGSVETIDLRLYGQVWSADKSLFTPRVYFDDGEVFNPIDGFESGDITKTQSGKEKIIRKNTGIALTFEDGDGTDLLQLSPSSGNTTIKNGRQLSFEGGTAYINAAASENFQLRSGTTPRLTMFGASGNFGAGADNAQTWGTASSRWSTIYAGTGSINTSDEREKQDIAEIDAAEKRVAVALKGLIRKFRFKDAVQRKGDDARIHVGVIAQEVIAAFRNEGLDPMRYGIVCYDEWEAEDGRPAGNRYGVRYEELIAFIIAAL